MSPKRIILLVDDDEGVLRAMRLRLSDLLEEYNRMSKLSDLPELNVEIQTAQCGHEALAKFAAHAADLVVTDFTMSCRHPEKIMNGLGLMKAIRALATGAQVKESEHLRASVNEALAQWCFEASVP